MTKLKVKLSCTSCGQIASKWLGQCPSCSEWNTFEEELIEKECIQRSVNSKRSNTDKEHPKKISEVVGVEYEKYFTGINEFDRVQGNGITKASITLLGGEPGIGKSTLLMEVCSALSNKYPQSNILYVSGEESSGQIAQRSKRLGVHDASFYILNETCWQDILIHIKTLKPRFFILDSIQTTVSSEISAMTGSVSQIKEVTYEIMNYAKANNLTCFIVGHVNKEGSIAGPKVLEHMVDTVISFEGDRLGQYRILRVVKNRFGDASESGIFEMSESGLKQIENPSKYFLDSSPLDAYGRSLSCILEGKRPLFVEIQALVVENKHGNPRRTTQGLDSNRLGLLIAVIDKYFQIPLSYNDIYVNIVGGIKSLGRETDLSVIASLISSFKEKKIESEVIFLGEVGLSGEVREVPMIEVRIKELEKLNYKQVILASASAKKLKNKFKIELCGISRANELNDLLY